MITIDSLEGLLVDLSNDSLPSPTFYDVRYRYKQTTDTHNLVGR